MYKIYLKMSINNKGNIDNMYIFKNILNYFD